MGASRQAGLIVPFRMRLPHRRSTHRPVWHASTPSLIDSISRFACVYPIPDRLDLPFCMRLPHRRSTRRPVWHASDPPPIDSSSRLAWSGPSPIDSISRFGMVRTIPDRLVVLFLGWSLPSPIDSISRFEMVRTIPDRLVVPFWDGLYHPRSTRRPVLGWSLPSATKWMPWFSEVAS